MSTPENYYEMLIENEPEYAIMLSLVDRPFGISVRQIVEEQIAFEEAQS